MNFYSLKILFHPEKCHITRVKCNYLVVNCLRSYVSLSLKKRQCELYNNHDLFRSTTQNKQQNKTRINVYLFHTHTYTSSHPLSISLHYFTPFKIATRFRLAKPELIFSAFKAFHPSESLLCQHTM